MPKDTSNNIKSENDIRISWIESLRGVAVILVFISHLYLINGTHFGFVIGRIGVVIFFLLTGFLSIRSRKRRTGKQYFFNRFMRMFPVYWLLLIIYFFVCLFFTENCPSLTSLLVNMFQFEEFVGVDAILGGSWMLPMQDIYFIGLSIFGIAFWNKKYKIKELRIDMPYFVMSLLMILAVITGLARYITNIPFPAAFFLLLQIAFLGMYKNLRGGVSALLTIFEMGLVLTAFFAYTNEWVYYIIAYNAGIFVFLFIEHYKNFDIKIFENLGKMGFTFFLGADTPMIILEHFIDFKADMYLIIVGYILKFTLAVAYAYLITRFVERPLLKWGKNIEKTIR